MRTTGFGKRNVMLSAEETSSRDYGPAGQSESDLSRSRSKRKKCDQLESPQCQNNEESIARQLNPFKISLVLERMFDFCPVETLRNCRLVSRQFRDDSMKAWRNKAVLKTKIVRLGMDVYSIRDGTDGSFPLQDYKELVEADDDDDDNVTVTFRKLKRHPFKRFSLVVPRDSTEFAGDTIRSLANSARCLKLLQNHCIGSIRIQQLGEFLSRFHLLEELHFKLSIAIEGEVEGQGRDQADVQVAPVNVKLRKVRRLVISQDTFTIINSRASKYVMERFPNLETLSLRVMGGTLLTLAMCCGGLKNILRAADNIRQSSPDDMAVKEFELWYIPGRDGSRVTMYDYAEERCTRDEIIPLIVRCHFPLERLTINFGWSGICRLLRSYKDTLKFLKTSFNFTVDKHLQGTGEWRSVEVPHASKIRMTQLKEASLGKGHHRGLSLLTHLKLPMLEKLTIEKDDDEIKTRNIHLSFPVGRVYNRLTTLEFLDNHSVPLPKTMEALTKMMPNLVHLTIPLDKTTFQIVCGRYRGLKTLNILSAEMLHEELDDECLTGVAKGRKKQRGQQSRRPNITDLSLLTDLKISCESQLLRNDVKYTEHSVLHGFLRLPHLYSLSIAFKDISESVMNKLLQHVKGNVDIQKKPPHVEHYIVEIGDASVAGQ